ncbi:MAG: ATP synthase F1 subunit delta, partial [Proteobacteria bacterium]|nr:ATP synthase F1 subunit delta [Pseudomonadota bacterium]
MKSTRVARRYAQALLESSESGRVLDSVLKDARLLHDYVVQSRELRSFLRSPVIKGETKVTVLRSLFEKSIAPLTMNFLLLLVHKNREEVLPEIIDELFRLHDERQGIVTLDLKAATQLSQDHRSAVVRRFEQITGKTVRVSFSVDATLKGGILARVG